MRFCVLVSLVVVSAALAESRKPLTVCEVLGNLQTYRDKVVAIRGEYLRDEEGTYLVGEKCTKPLIIPGYTWRNPIPIFLTPPDSPLVDKPSDVPSPVIVEPGSAEILRVYGADPGVRIWATFVGRLETRASFEMVVRGDGKTVPYGYGHMDACPAQLVYYKITDAAIRKPSARK